MTAFTALIQTQEGNYLYLELPDHCVIRTPRGSAPQGILGFRTVELAIEDMRTFDNITVLPWAMY
jgi:hypothetical protein